MIILILLFVFLAFPLIVIKTLQNGISPMPSSYKAVKAIISLIPKDFDGTLVDLGSGWGHLAFALACAFPNARIIGYENSLIPYLFSRLFIKKNLQFRYQDFLDSSLPTADIAVCYLFPKAMTTLSSKLQTTPFPIKTLISSTFALPDHTPIQTLTLKDLYNTPIYLYQISLD